MSEPGKKTAVRDEILSTAKIGIEQQLRDGVLGRIAYARTDHESKPAFQLNAARASHIGGV
jgi:hypothetical protein